MKIENPSATYLTYANLRAARVSMRQLQKCTASNLTHGVDHEGAVHYALQAREYLDATQLHLKNVLLDGHPLWLAKRIEAWSAEEVSLYNEVDEIMNGLLRLQPGGGS